MIAGRSPQQSLLDIPPRPAQATAASRTALDRAMDRAAEGDLAAFDEVFAGLAPRIRGFLERMSGSRAVASELTESVFAGLFAARGAFGRSHGVVAWAYAIARDACLRDARVGGSSGLGSDVSASDAGNSRNAETASASLVARTLLTLPIQDREAFVLSRFEGLSVAEVVQIVGASETSIRQRAARAHEVLRAALAAHAAVRASA